MFNIQKSKEEKSFRQIKDSSVSSKFINFGGQKLLNLASNDYLGIATNKELRDEFLELCKDKEWFFGSGASRLVYTSSLEFGELESYLGSKFNGKEATIFNSGYCANLSCVSSLNDTNTLFVADKLIHASIVDALKISNANYKRFSHNDFEELEKILSKNHNNFEKIIILSEALFSMDGDGADIKALVEFKKRYPNIMLYVDEAHSFFARDQLGKAKALGLDEEIDFLLVTFGKAVGSHGAAILSKKEYKDIFVNSARSLIYSTALPSINVAWTNFILQKDFSKEREQLENNIKFLGLNDSHICPFMTYSNETTIGLASSLAKAGYFVPAIRPPTVLPNQSRIRISLRGDITQNELKVLKEIIDEVSEHQIRLQ